MTTDQRDRFCEFYPAPWQLQLGPEVVDSFGDHVHAFDDTPEDHHFWEGVAAAVNFAYAEPSDAAIEAAARVISPYCLWSMGYVNAHTERRRDNARTKARAALIAAQGAAP